MGAETDGPAAPPDRWFVHAVDLLKVLAVETRLRILWALLHGEHSVNDLAEHVGAKASAVSQNLSLLREMGLVTTRRQGNFIYYSCDHPHVRALATEALSHAEHMIGGVEGVEVGHRHLTGQPSA